MHNDSLISFELSMRARAVRLLCVPGSVFAYKLRYIVGFGLVETTISTNPKPTIYRKLCENTSPGGTSRVGTPGHQGKSP